MASGVPLLTRSNRQTLARRIVFAEMPQLRSCFEIFPKVIDDPAESGR